MKVTLEVITTGDGYLGLTIVKNSGHFGQKSNRKVPFGSVWSDWNIQDQNIVEVATLTGRTKIYRSILTNRLTALRLFRGFQLCKEFVKGTKNGEPFLSVSPTGL